MRDSVGSYEGKSISGLVDNELTDRLEIRRMLTRSSVLSFARGAISSLEARNQLDKRLLVLTGPPGYGKSTLLNEVLATMREDGSRCKTVVIDFRWNPPRTAAALLIMLKAALEGAELFCDRASKRIADIGRLEKRLQRHSKRFPQIWEKAEKEARASTTSAAVDIATAAVASTTGAPSPLVRPAINLLADVANQVLDRTVYAFAEELAANGVLTADERSLAQRPDEALLAALRVDIASETLNYPLCIAFDTVEVSDQLFPWLCSSIVANQEEAGDVLWVIAGQWLRLESLASKVAVSNIEFVELGPLSQSEMVTLVQARIGVTITPLMAAQVEGVTFGVPILADYLLATAEFARWVRGETQALNISNRNVMGDALRDVVDSLVGSVGDLGRRLLTLLAIAQDSYDAPSVRRTLASCGIGQDVVEDLVASVPLLRLGRLHDSVETILRTAIRSRKGALLSVQEAVIDKWHDECTEAWRKSRAEATDIYGIFRTGRSRREALRYCEAALWTGRQIELDAVLKVAVQAIGPSDVTTASILRLVGEAWEHRDKVAGHQLVIVRALASLVAGDLALTESNTYWHRYNNTPRLLLDIKTVAMGASMDPACAVYPALLELEIFLQRSFSPADLNLVPELIGQLDPEDLRLVSGYAGWILLSIVDASKGSLAGNARSVALEQAYSLLHGNTGELVHLGEVCADIGDNSLAARAASAAAELDPYSDEYISRACGVLNAAGEPASALAVAQRALLANPTDSALLFRAVYSCVLLSRFSEALEFALRQYRSDNSSSTDPEAIREAAALVMFIQALASIESGRARDLAPEIFERAGEAQSNWSTLYRAIFDAVHANSRASWLTFGETVRNLDAANTYEAVRFEIYVALAGHLATSEAALSRLDLQQLLHDKEPVPDLVAIVSRLLPVVSDEALGELTA